MDTKKLILAIVLSVVIISVYQYFFMPKPEVKPQDVKHTTSLIQEKKDQEHPTEKSSTQNISKIFSEKQQKEKVAQPVTESVKEDLKANKVRDIKVETDLFYAVFTNKGAGLKSLVLKKYRDDKQNPLDLVSKKVEKFGLYPFYFFPKEEGVFDRINNSIFYFKRFKNNGKTELIFQYKDKTSNLNVQKKFIFMNNSYVIDVQYKVIKNGVLVDAPFVFGPDLENNISKARTMQAGLKIGAYNGDAIKSVTFSKLKTEQLKGQPIEKVKGSMGRYFSWAAYETTYFSVIFETKVNNSLIEYSVIKEKFSDGQKIKDKLYSYIIVTNPGKIYLGPKDEKELSKVADIFEDANKAIEYGWFGSIAKIMQKGINFTYEKILNSSNYGWAIVLFTLLLKLILFPLTYTSSVSMAKMQTLQPKMKALKKKYKNQKDPEQRKAMNVEMMALYKREKVNPAGGCLPMLLQIPLLWGLFRLLAVSINVRHEPWIFWIKDLSLKDPLYIIPILMGITQIILQKMTPSGGEGAQKKMMYIMPVVITFIVMNMASGLTLYWLVSNLLQLGQQYIINEKVHKKMKEEQSKRKATKRKKGAKNK